MPSFGAVKLLQARTGCSREDCKQALAAHGDDQDAAAAVLLQGTSSVQKPPCVTTASKSAMQLALDHWAEEEKTASASIRTVEAGDCATYPVAGDLLTMHYRGMLQADGTEFDSSYTRSKPFTFRLGAGEVIRGWDETVGKMSLGERALLYVASDYAYGTQGCGRAVPPSADLLFEVHLLDVERGSASAQGPEGS